MYIGLGLPITAIRGAAGFGGAISTATVGQTVYAVLPITGPGNPPGAPNATPTLRWQRNGTNIPGATGVAYVVQAADIGAGTLSVVGTGTAGEAISIPAISVQAVPVVPVAPANTVAPTISGTAQEGQTLTVARGTWTGTGPITYAYQWQRGGVDIAGATATTYAAVFDDVGTTLRVVVTASNAGGVVSANSAATAVVSAQPPSSTFISRYSTVPVADPDPVMAAYTPDPAQFDFYSRFDNGLANEIAGGVALTPINAPLVADGRLKTIGRLGQGARGAFASVPAEVTFGVEVDYRRYGGNPNYDRILSLGALGANSSLTTGHLTLCIHRIGREDHLQLTHANTNWYNVPIPSPRMTLLLTFRSGRCALWVNGTKVLDRNGAVPAIKDYAFGVDLSDPMFRPCTADFGGFFASRAAFDEAAMRTAAANLGGPVPASIAAGTAILGLPQAVADGRQLTFNTSGIEGVAA